MILTADEKLVEIEQAIAAQRQAEQKIAQVQQQAEQQIAQAQLEAIATQQQAERLAAKLRELGVDPNTLV